MYDTHFLSNVFSPRQFSAEQLEAIIPRFKQVTFARNDFLLAEGKTANDYWFVQSGFLRSFVIDTEGNDISTDFYTTGDILIDWTSFFLRKPTRENIQALTDCVCWQLDFESFQQLFHSMEPFREAGRKRLVESYFALKNHSIAMIADQAKDRYLRLVTEKPQILQNVSLKHIASYLGITDTSLSRIRKEVSSE